MADEKKFKINGILSGVSCTQSKEGVSKAWKRASLKITKSDGTIFTVATFDEDDIKTANEANGKEVEAVYTKSKDDQYNNMIKGGLTVKGNGETPITDEEAVEDTSKEEPKEEKGTPQLPQKTNWDLKHQRDLRSMLVSYAKDLAVEKLIKVTEIKSTAQTLFEFVWDGYEEDKKPTKK